MPLLLTYRETIFRFDAISCEGIIISIRREIGTVEERTSLLGVDLHCGFFSRDILNSLIMTTTIQVAHKLINTKCLPYSDCRPKIL